MAGITNNVVQVIDDRIMGIARLTRTTVNGETAQSGQMPRGIVRAVLTKENVTRSGSKCKLSGSIEIEIFNSAENTLERSKRISVLENGSVPRLEIPSTLIGSYKLPNVKSTGPGHVKTEFSTETSQLTSQSLRIASDTVLIGDINGDGADDLIVQIDNRAVNRKWFR